MIRPGPEKHGVWPNLSLDNALLILDECEQVVASFAAAVAALVDEDAELLGQWGLLMEWIKNSRGTPPALGRRYEQSIVSPSACKSVGQG